jgi:hypothetical protein
MLLLLPAIAAASSTKIGSAMLVLAAVAAESGCMECVLYPRPTGTTMLLE